jgi:hypothetical protein
MMRVWKKSMAVACIGAAAGLAGIGPAGCSGGGGDPSPPEMPSGVVDFGYGPRGAVVFNSGEHMFDSALDTSGNAYVAGDSIVKVDRSGNRVAGYGGPTASREFAPLVDDAGNLFTASLDGAVVKRDAAGHVDASFGDAGRAQVTPWGGFPSQIVALHRDAAGNLIVVGLARGPHYSFNSVALAKLDPQGHLVASFGSGGRRITPVELHPFDPELVSKDDAEGGVGVAGRDSLGRPIVAKLDANGDLIAGFAQAGVWVAPSCGAASEAALALAATAARDVYLGVSCEGAPTIFKVDAAGTLVGSFGSAGRAAGFFPNSGTVGGLLPQSDGSLYVAGTTPAPNSCPQLAVAKLDAGGVLVARFGANGVAFPYLASAGTFRKVLARDASGLLYVGTYGTQCPLFGPEAPYTIVRMSP